MKKFDQVGQLLAREKREEGKGVERKKEDSPYQLIPDIIIYKRVHGHMHADSFFLFNSMITVRPFSTGHSIHTHTHIHRVIQNHLSNSA